MFNISYCCEEALSREDTKRYMIDCNDDKVLTFIFGIYVTFSKNIMDGAIDIKN